MQSEQKIPKIFQKPKHKGTVVATARGWVVEETGELLVSVRGLADKLAEYLSPKVIDVQFVIQGIQDKVEGVVDVVQETIEEIKDSIENAVDEIQEVVSPEEKVEDQGEPEVVETEDDSNEDETTDEEIDSDLDDLVSNIEESEVVETTTPEVVEVAPKKRGRPAKAK